MLMLMWLWPAIAVADVSLYTNTSLFERTKVLDMDMDDTRYYI